MAVPKILKGDDTSANGRGITLTLPNRDMGGLKVCAVFFGHEFVFDSPAPGSTVRLDFKADQTRLMPVGTHNMGLYVIGPDGASYTLSETIKVGVTDNVAEAYGGDASNINLAIEMKSGLPDLSDVPTNPRTANALAEAFKKLLDTLKGSAFAIAFMACLTALGAGVNVQKERIGDVDFDAEVVTNVTFDATGLVKIEEIADVVREDGLKSMSWTNANYAASVLGIVNPLFMSDEFSGRVEGIVDGAVEGRFFSSTGGVIRSKGGPLPMFKLANAYNDDGAVGFWDGLWRFGAQSWFDVDESVPLLHVEPVGSGYGVIEVFGHTGPASIKKDGVEVATVDDLNTMSNALASAIVGSGGLTPEMATNVARAVAQPHIDNRNNPHGVTASQVGAIPQNLNSPYTISLGEFPLFFSSTVGGSESPEMSVSSDGVWISGLNVDGQLVKGGDDVATVPFVISASNNLARVRLDIVLQTYPNQHYEIQLNGVRQTFDQVADLASNRDCYIKRANGIYHPTYVSAAEVMFDCVGTIQGLIETRRIHMVASTGSVTIGDLKVIADRDWVESLPTTYTNFSGTAFVALNQSVQTITTHGEQITITMPNAVTGGTRDFCVYINNEGSTDSPLWLPSGTYYGDEDCTNAVKSGIVTALYFTEMSGGKFMLGRRELAQISVSH